MVADLLEMQENQGLSENRIDKLRFVLLFDLLFKCVDHGVAQFLRRYPCPDLRGVVLRIVIAPLIIIVLADLAGTVILRDGSPGVYLLGDAGCVLSLSGNKYGKQPRRHILQPTDVVSPESAPMIPASASESACFSLLILFEQDPVDFVIDIFENIEYNLDFAIFF